MSFANTLRLPELPFFSGKASYTPAAMGDQVLAREIRDSNVADLSLVSTKRDILSLAKVTVGWDDHGAQPPPPGAVSNSQEWLSTMHAYIVQSRLNWVRPHVSASERGEIVLEWWRDNRKLSVYIDDTAATFVRVWGPDMLREMDDGVLEPSKVLDLWAWLNK